MITKFGKYRNIKRTYYKLFIDKSYDKLKFALKKLDLLDNFKSDWNIDEWDDIIPLSQKIIPNNNIVYIVINSLEKITIFGENDFGEKYHEYYRYGGEVHVEDYELAADKYNIF